MVNLLIRESADYTRRMEKDQILNVRLSSKPTTMKLVDKFSFLHEISLIKTKED